MAKINKEDYENKVFIDKNNEKFKVLKVYSSTYVSILYLSSNMERKTTLDRVRKGNVQNPIHGNRYAKTHSDWINVEKRNNENQKMKVLEAKADKVLIIFEKTNTKKWVYKTSFTSGKVKDEFSPSVSNTGFLGNYDRVDIYGDKIYQLWRRMIGRCYGFNERSNCYIGVTVSDDWKNFEIFQKEVKMLDGYEDWKLGKDVELDKDQRSGVRKQYSKETCCFISSADNKKRY